MLRSSHVESLSPRTASDRFFMARLVIVDIRDRAEYDRARVPGSLHIPRRQVRRRLHELRSDRPVAFLCRTGRQSKVAARTAAKHRDDIATVAGGINAWLAAG